MSGDEALLLLVSLGAGLYAWVLWYRGLYAVPVLGTPLLPRQLLAATPLFCAGLLYVVLRGAAAHDVRDSVVYLSLYAVFGAAWIGAGAHATRLLGLSARDDVIERGNMAAAVALGGALVAVTLCFAGGNIGDGPGWWVVLFSALLATLTLLLLWFVLDRLTGAADEITIERDVAAGVRLGGFLVACGLVLGRAVAGDWVSGAATVHDFAVSGWPVLVLLALAVVVDRGTRVTPDRTRPSPTVHGLLPALLYVALALFHVVNLGAFA